MADLMKRERKLSNMELTDMADVELSEAPVSKKRFLVDLNYFEVYQSTHGYDNACVDFPMWYMAQGLDVAVAIVLIWVLAASNCYSKWFAYTELNYYWNWKLAWYGFLVDVVLYGPKTLVVLLRPPPPVNLKHAPAETPNR